MALTLTATPNTSAGTVDLDVSGLAVFGATVDAPTNNGANWTATSGASVGTIGSSLAVDLSVDTSAIGSGSATRTLTGLEAFQHYVAEVWIGTYWSSPVEVSLQVAGRGRTDWIILTEDGTPGVTYTRLRYYFQSNATTHTFYVSMRPLYPFVTFVAGQFKDFTVKARPSTFGIYSPDSDAVVINRTDANGTAPVIVPEPNDANTTGVLSLTDYEAALVGPITYTVSDTDSKNMAPHQYASDTVVLNLTAGDDVLPHLTRGDDDVTVDVVLDYTADRESTGTLHRVIGRAAPVTITGPLTTRTGTLELYAPTYARALDVIDLLADGRPVMLRQGDYSGLDMWLVATRVSERPFEQLEGRWRVTVQYAEVTGRG